eukprot:NODE_908_length_3163_cov_0.507180.p2 type:complete len:250 gc:universal NODE_908_length_3163_cov_0.507180:1224-475(-)
MTDFEWSQFDVYCINLVTREDRFHHIKTLFQNLGIKANIKRVVKHNDPKTGLIESCCIIFEEYMKRNSGNHLLLFEDDVIVADSNIDTQLLQINGFLNTNIKWDILRLGMNKGVYLEEYDHVYRCNALGNHAVIYNKNFVPSFLKYIRNSSNHVDRLLSYATGRCYILKNQLFYQGELGTNNFWGEGKVMNEYQLEFQKSPIAYQRRYAEQALDLWVKMKRKPVKEQKEMFFQWADSTLVAFENELKIE